MILYEMKFKLFLSLISLLFWYQGNTQHIRDLTGSYLGQNPPGMKPKIFAPGVISTKYYELSAPAFSPDGKTVFWTVIYARGKPSRIMEMRIENGIWTKPCLAAFADTTSDDFYPSFSADGKKLYFSSRRKLPIGYPENNGLRIWEVEKKTTGWGSPIPLDTAVFKPENYYHSITNAGVIYTSRRSNGGSVFDIEVYRRKNAHYIKPKTLPYNINSKWTEDGVFIAPDESYLIFESDRPGGLEGSTDLYISFRRKDGSWSIAKNMGPNINSVFTERFARVSPDGKYLFFGSDRDLKPGSDGADIYWVDAKVIDVMKKQELHEHESSIDKGGKEVMPAIYQNDYKKTILLLREWITTHPADVGGYIDYFFALRKSQQFEESEKQMKIIPANILDNADLKTELILINYSLNKNEDAKKIIATLPVEKAGQRSRRLSLASSLNTMKKYTESAKLYEIAMKMPSDYYNMGCVYSLSGNKDKAIESLNRAADLGFNNLEQYENDSDLELLKTDDRFKELLKRLVSAMPAEDPHRPFKRAHHEMIYDDGTKSIKLMGGSTPLNGGQSAKTFNDIWRYNNSGWSKLGTIAEPRNGNKLAFDSKRNKLYSFGGFAKANQPSGQLRLFENGDWKIITDMPDMKATEAGFVYDINRDKFVVFGGSVGRSVNNTTWEWDGNSWTKFTGPQPEGRNSFAMVYDSKRNKTVLFGGASESVIDDGVWEFDGKEWKNYKLPNGPGQRIAPGYTFDSKRGMLLIFGGIGANGVKGDTWGWNGIEWKLLSETGPSSRLMGYMAYDKERDRTVLFGGRLGWPNDVADTWEWDGTKWEEVKF